MMSSDDLQMPRDPGPVPGPVRDAFAWALDAQRAAAPTALPDDDALNLLVDEEGSDDERFALIEQLLGSSDGARTLAHVVAARTSTAGSDEYFAATDVAPAAPRALRQRQDRWRRR